LLLSNLVPTGRGALLLFYYDLLLLDQQATTTGGSGASVVVCGMLLFKVASIFILPLLITFQFAALYK